MFHGRWLESKVCFRSLTGIFISKALPVHLGSPTTDIQSKENDFDRLSSGANLKGEKLEF